MNVRLRKGGPLLRWLVPGALLLGTTLGIVVAARTEVTALRYRLVQLLERETHLRAEVEKLRIEGAALASPKRVEKRARALGLADPRPGQVIALSSSSDRPPPRTPGDSP